MGIEKWRLPQLEGIAYESAKKILNKKSSQNNRELDSFDEEIDAVVNRRRIVSDIEFGEEDDLANLIKKQVERLMNHKLELEEGTARLNIEPSPKRAKEKKDIGKSSKFESEKVTSPSKVFERAEDMAKFATRKELSIDEKQFEERIKQLMEELRNKYPFLFNSETGEPLTAIQAAYIFPYELTEREKSEEKTGKTATVRYRIEVLKLEQYVSKIIKKSLGKLMPNGLTNPIRLSISSAAKVMQSDGVILYLPELYHGISPSLAQEHYNKYLQEDFRLCEPLQGLMIAAQNLENLDRDYYLLGQRAQAYHMVKNTEFKEEHIFSLLLTPTDVGFVRRGYKRASSDVSSGLIFDPQPEE